MRQRKRERRRREREELRDFGDRLEGITAGQTTQVQGALRDLRAQLERNTALHRMGIQGHIHQNWNREFLEHIRNYLILTNQNTDENRAFVESIPQMRDFEEFSAKFYAKFHLTPGEILNKIHELEVARAIELSLEPTVDVLVPGLEYDPKETCEIPKIEEEEGEKCAICETLAITNDPHQCPYKLCRVCMPRCLGKCPFCKVSIESDKYKISHKLKTELRTIEQHISDITKKYKTDYNERIIQYLSCIYLKYKDTDLKDNILLLIKSHQEELG